MHPVLLYIVSNRTELDESTLGIAPPTSSPLIAPTQGSLQGVIEQGVRAPMPS
jgi:hypothetical protein